MVLDRQFRYVDANPAYLAVTGRSMDELRGRSLFEVFPDEGESGRRLRASFEKVLRTGEPDTLPLIHYAIPVPGGEGFEDRFWSAVHTPLPGPDGEVAHILQNTVDVTELIRSRIDYDRELRPGEVDILQRAQEAERAQRRIEAESEDFRRLFAQAPGFMAVLMGADHVFTFANDEYLRLVGGRSVLGQPIRRALPEIESQGFVDLLDDVLHAGQRVSMTGARVLLRSGEDETLGEHFLDFTYQPALDAEGRAIGVFVQGVDVTEKVRASARQALLMDELNHRVKNTLASVQAIASQTLRSVQSPEAFRPAFEARLQALSRAHDRLTRGQWEGAGLADILADELRAFGEDRVTMRGPAATLPAREALALSLVVHELATNAAKYGALSADAGRLRLDWGVRDEPDGAWLHLVWRERGGPHIDGVPERRGFGSRLIERSVTRDLNGRLDRRFAPDGLTCEISIPFAPAEAL